LLDCDCSRLVRSLAESCIVSDKRQQHRARVPSHSQRRRVSQSPRLGDCRVIVRQRAVRKAETEGRNPPNTPVILPGGGSWPGELVRGGQWDHKTQARSPHGTGKQQTCRQTSGLDPRTGDPERAQRSRCAGGSDAADPRPGVAPIRTRRGRRESATAHRGREGTPRGNRAAPTALWRARKHGLFPTRPSL